MCLGESHPPATGDGPKQNPSLPGVLALLGVSAMFPFSSSFPSFHVNTSSMNRSSYSFLFQCYLRA